MEFLQKVIPDISNFRIDFFDSYIENSQKESLNDAGAIRSDFDQVLGYLGETVQKYENGEIKAPKSSK